MKEKEKKSAILAKRKVEYNKAKVVPKSVGNEASRSVVQLARAAAFNIMSSKEEERRKKKSILYFQGRVEKWFPGLVIYS